MAEQVKRRVSAARLAVAFAAAGVIAGGAATATGAPDRLPPNSIGTQEIRNDSLLHKDFKTGEVYSKDDVAKKFLKIDEAGEKFLKIDDAANTYIKGESLNGYLKIEDAANTYIKEALANTTFLKIEEAANTYIKGESLNGYLKIDDADLKYLKIDDANQKFLKIDATAANAAQLGGVAAEKWLKIDDANQKFLGIGATAADSAKLGGLSAGDFVQGDGSVITGATAVAQGDDSPLLKLDKVIDVGIDNSSSPPSVMIIRSGDFNGDLTYATDKGGGTIDNQVAVPFDDITDTQIVQILIGGTSVGTLSVSAVDIPGGTQAFGQLLVGTEPG